MSVPQLANPLVPHKLPDLNDDQCHKACKIDGPSTDNNTIYKTLQPWYMLLVDLHTNNR